MSAAAGAVGTYVLPTETCLLLVLMTYRFRFVCEYAKAINPNIKVIGSAGSKEKVEELKKIGVDVVINYKEQDLAAVLKEHGPIDMCVRFASIELT